MIFDMHLQFTDSSARNILRLLRVVKAVTSVIYDYYETVLAQDLVVAGAPAHVNDVDAPLLTPAQIANFVRRAVASIRFIGQSNNFHFHPDPSLCPVSLLDSPDMFSNQALPLSSKILMLRHNS